MQTNFPNQHARRHFVVNDIAKKTPVDPHDWVMVRKSLKKSFHLIRVFKLSATEKKKKKKTKPT